MRRVAEGVAHDSKLVGSVDVQSGSVLDLRTVLA
jgi:hypothetical protein